MYPIFNLLNIHQTEYPLKHNFSKTKTLKLLQCYLITLSKRGGLRPRNLSILIPSHLYKNSPILLRHKLRKNDIYMYA